MFPKNYLKIGLTPASGEICICAPGVRPFWPNVHPDLSTCGQLEKVYYKSYWSFIWNSNIPHVTKTQIDATLNQIKSLESYEKCFLFHLNCSFVSCNILILGRNWEVENRISVTL